MNTGYFRCQRSHRYIYSLSSTLIIIVKRDFIISQVDGMDRYDVELPMVCVCVEQP